MILCYKATVPLLCYRSADGKDSKQNNKQHIYLNKFCFLFLFSVISLIAKVITFRNNAYRLKTHIGHKNGQT